MMHQTTEMMIKPPTIMSAMTGHLSVSGQHYRSPIGGQGKLTCNK